MANKMIPEELQALIAQYLTDGVLTTKEREVILKKAESMGLDRDEIDLYLDAEVQKIDQATDAAVRKQKGRQCPFCGASIPVLTDKCPECGGSITPEADKELEEILEKLEEALVDFKSGKDFEKSKATVERYSRRANMYYGSNPKIQKLLTDVEEEMMLAEKKAKTKSRNNTIGEVFKTIFRSKVFLCVAIGLFVILGVVKCVDFMRDPNGWEQERKEREAAEENVRKDLETFFADVSKLIREDKLDEAKDMLTDHIIPSSFDEEDIAKTYDATYLKLIRAYEKKGKMSDVEELLLSFKGKIGSSYYFEKTGCYIYMQKMTSEDDDASEVLEEDDDD